MLKKLGYDYNEDDENKVIKYLVIVNSFNCSK